MPLCMPCLFLPHQATAHNLVMLNTCNCLYSFLLVRPLGLHDFYFRHPQIICDFNFQLIKTRTLKLILFGYLSCHKSQLAHKSCKGCELSSRRRLANLKNCQADDVTSQDSSNFGCESELEFLTND